MTIEKSIEKKFEEIKTIRFSIKNTFKTLTEKHKEIKEQYKKYIENNKKNDLLDSFYFQIKLMDYEYETTDKLYNLIDNRMYCDYYKLFIIVYNFFKAQFKNEKSEMIIKNSKYPVYKDLDHFKLYDFDTVNDIHQDIIRLVDYINKIIHQNESEIKTHKLNAKSGLNIDNYIFNLEYNNFLIKNNHMLYINYLSAYHKYHTSFLTNLHNKLNLIYDQLDNDVNFNQPIKEKKNNMINQMCILCTVKEAEYCGNCTNDDKDENDRYANLRNSIQNDDDFEIVNRPSNVVIENPPVDNTIINNIIDQPNLHPIGEEVIVDSVIEEPIVDLVIEEPLIEETFVDPIFEEQVIEQPLIKDSVNEEPIIKEPVIEKPLIKESVNETSVIEDSVNETPVIEESVNETLVNETPLIEEPVNETLVNETPLIEEPVIEESVIKELIIEEPIIVEPIVEPIIEDQVIEVNNIPEYYLPIINEEIPDANEIINDEIIIENIIEINNPILIINNNDQNNNDKNNNDKNASPIQLLNESKQSINDSNDVNIDNITNTVEIEKKINKTTPYFLELDLLPSTELSHPHQKKKKHKKK
jgi:hypothetical protein